MKVVITDIKPNYLPVGVSGSEMAYFPGTTRVSFNVIFEDLVLDGEIKIQKPIDNMTINDIKKEIGKKLKRIP